MDASLVWGLSGGAVGHLRCNWVNRKSWGLKNYTAHAKHELSHKSVCVALPHIVLFWGSGKRRLAQAHRSPLYEKFRAGALTVLPRCISTKLKVLASLDRLRWRPSHFPKNPKHDPVQESDDSGWATPCKAQNKHIPGYFWLKSANMLLATLIWRWKSMLLKFYSVSWALCLILKPTEGENCQLRGRDTEEGRDLGRLEK